MLTKTQHLTCWSILFEEGGGSINLKKKTGIKQIAQRIYLSKATCHPLHTLWRGGGWDHEVTHGFQNSSGSWEAWHRGVQELCPWEGTAAAGTPCTQGHGISRAVHPQTQHQPCPWTPPLLWSIPLGMVPTLKQKSVFWSLTHERLTTETPWFHILQGNVCMWGETVSFETNFNFL